MALDKVRYVAPAADKFCVLWFSGADGGKITDPEKDKVVPGFLMETVGYKVREDADWMILATTYESDSKGTIEEREYYGIKSIPKAVIVESYKLVKSA